MHSGFTGSSVDVDRGPGEMLNRRLSLNRSWYQFDICLHLHKQASEPNLGGQDCAIASVCFMPFAIVIYLNETRYFGA